MAKVSKIVANKRKANLAEKSYKKRKELRRQSLDMNLSEEQRYEAYKKLATMPLSTAPVRVRNRCELTGRTRGYLRKFGLCRIKVREYAHKGLLPGVTKSSW
jgi:small subunit ribosomal protein S14